MTIDEARDLAEYAQDHGSYRVFLGPEDWAELRKEIKEKDRLWGDLDGVKFPLLMSFFPHVYINGVRFSEDCEQAAAKKSAEPN